MHERKLRGTLLAMLSTIALAENSLGSIGLECGKAVTQSRSSFALTQSGVLRVPFAVSVAKFGGRLDALLSDGETKLLARVLRISPLKLSTLGLQAPDPDFVTSLKLNPQGVRVLENGVLHLTRSLSSTSGMGVESAGIPQPAIHQLETAREGLEGHCLMPVGDDPGPNRGSVWGGRFAHSSHYVLFKGDALDYLGFNPEVQKRVRELLAGELWRRLALLDVNGPLVQDLRPPLDSRSPDEFNEYVASLFQHGYQAHKIHLGSKTSGYPKKDYFPPGGFFYREAAPDLLEIVGLEDQHETILAELSANDGIVEKQTRFIPNADVTPSPTFRVFKAEVRFKAKS